MAESSAKRAESDTNVRSKVVGVRLDPKLRYLAELAARKQRRSLSSYIEWAVENSLHEVKLSDGLSVSDRASGLWDVDEAERFARLAIFYPDLMNHEEQEIWKMIGDSLLLLPATNRNPGFSEVSWDWSTLEDRVFPKLREHWPSLMKAFAEGASSRRQWVDRMKLLVAEGKVYPGFTPGKNPDPGFDDDLPF